GLDSIVVRFRPAGHALAPPVEDDAVIDLRARPVEVVEGPAREVVVELRTVRCQRLAESVELLDRNTARVRCRLEPDRRHRTDQNSFRYAAIALEASHIARDLAAAG